MSDQGSVASGYKGPSAPLEEVASVPTWEGRAKDFGYTVTAPQSSSGKPNISPELASLAATLGVDPSVLVGAEDPSDPSVYTGGRYVEDQLHGGKRWMADPEGKEKTSKAYASFYGMAPDELRSFQEQAFAAGLYPKSMKKGDVSWGDYDEATFLAWRTMVDRSAGFLAAGKKITPQQALMDAVKKAPTESGPTREPLVIRLSNPDDVRSVLNAAIVHAAGGAASYSPEQLDQFVNQIHDIERQTQRQTYEAGGSGLPGGPGGEVTDVGDIGEKARQKVFADKPKETRTYSYLESYNGFMDLLKSAG